MIVDDRPILPAAQFALQLAQALRGVARVTVRKTDGDAPSICTGWFVTDDLVVVPLYAFGHTAASFVLDVQAFGGGAPWHGQATFTLTMATDQDPLVAYGQLHKLVVVRVAPTAERRALRIGLGARTEREQIALLHFANAAPEPALSFGELQGTAAPLLHNASTQFGSGGAPMFDVDWRVIGCQYYSRYHQNLNAALGTDDILASFRASPFWSEIAHAHSLTDPRAAQQQLVRGTRQDASAMTLRRAAVFASLPTSEMSELIASVLREYVVDPSKDRWVLRPDVRQRVLRDAGSLAALRDARGDSPAQDALQGAIDHVLQGPPYRFTELAEPELASSIQVVRWFRAIAPELPTPAVLSRELERRRLRTRLERVAGPDFRGRDRERAFLEDWFASNRGPLSITGIGGIGKSALLGRFALGLPKDTVLLWLDFDRPDLAPDSARSIVSVLVDQVAAQLQPVEVDPADERAAAKLGEKLFALVGDHPPLLVLDSFEVAQYAERYQELWPVLEQLVTTLPQLRVVVSGRAPVADLVLGGHAAVSLPLTGLEPDDARKWLQANDVAAVHVERVVELARGIPLILKLAAKYLATGGSLDGLPDELVDGMLYHRILDRVVDPELKPVAKAMIVLRRLTRDMIEVVLQPLVPLPARPAAEWFSDLGREMALVEGSDELRLRSEVRAAALSLLERDQPGLVAALDAAAARWYETHEPELPANAAELVYHRLRLHDVDGAALAWRDGCGAYLQTAGDALPGDMRSWLAGRLGSTRVRDVPIEVWEAEASERIREALARGLERHLAGILGERAERSANSPLVFYDAYVAWTGNALAVAKRALDAPSQPGSGVERDRAILRAAILQAEGNRAGADAVLAALDADVRWIDRRHGQEERAVLQAARVALATALDDELALLRDDAAPARVREVLAPVDVCFPRLADALVGEANDWERVLRIPLSTERLEDVPRGLSKRADDARREALPNEPQGLRLARRQEDPSSAVTLPADPRLASATRIAVAGWRRWRTLSSTTFLFDALRHTTALRGRLGAAILGPLLLVSESLRNERGLVRDQLMKHVERIGFLPVAPATWDTARMQIALGCVEDDAARFARVSLRGGELDLSAVLQLRRSPGLAYFLLAPDPLITLVHRLAGRDERKAME